MKILIVWRNHFFHRSHRCIAVQGRLNSDPVYCEHKLGHTLTIEQILNILRFISGRWILILFLKVFRLQFYTKTKSEANVQFTIESFKRGLYGGWFVLFYNLSYLARRLSSVRYFETKNTTNNKTTKQLFAIFLPKKTKRRRGIKYHIYCF